MLVHPQFDPIAIQLGPVGIHWYGLTYLVAFGLFLWLATLRTRQPQYAQAGWNRREVEDMLFWGVLGVVIGGRLGYVLFYKPGYYVAHPLEVAMVFPQSGTAIARHPSQLYQVALEGLLLFVLLWLYARKPRALGQVSGVFLIGYGVLRFTAEFFREPDNFLGPLALGLSMGQWLCVPMVLAGAAIWLWARPTA